MAIKTFRRRWTKVHSPYGYDGGKGYDTQLEVYPSIIRLYQDRSYKDTEGRDIHIKDIVFLDPKAMEYLTQLWEEVLKKIEEAKNA